MNDALWRAVADLFIPKVTLLGTAHGALWLWLVTRGTHRRLREENRRLREWQGSQSKAPELGPHRSAEPRECSPCLDPSHLHFDPRAAWAAITGRPAPPEPTSVPSKGRIVER